MTRLYEMKDMGEASSFLGVEISRERKERLMYLSQPGYVQHVLSKFGMKDCSPVKTPAVTESKATECEQSLEKLPLREPVGSLLYLANRTRPDISAAVGAVAREVSNPRKTQWTSVKRILRYLKGTAAYCLMLKCSKEGFPVLEGFSDANWAGDLQDRKSVSGYVIQLSQGKKMARVW